MVTAVAGVDLSIASTGVCRLAWDPETDEVSPRTFQIRSTGEPAATLQQQYTRMRDVRARVAAAVDGADVVLIEAPAPGLGANKGGIALWGLWWQVVGDLLDDHCAVATVSPSSLKVYTVGYGGSAKRPVRKPEIRRAVEQRYPQLLTGGSHDVAEAIGLAAMCARHIGRPIDQMPAVHLVAMSKIRWPELPGGTDPCL